MKYQRILVIGGNGSGKTTFSIELAKKFNLPLLHLDKIGWRNTWEMTPREEFDRILFEELQKSEWIIDGNYNRTISKRLQYCNRVYYFDFSTLSCLLGVTSRIINNYGKSRDDMGGYCPDRFDWSFYRNILAFNKKNRKFIYDAIANYPNIEVVVFKNRKQVREYLEKI